MRIDPGQLLLGDVVDETPFVVGVSRRCLGNCLAGGIRNKQLLTRDANALAPMLRVNLRSMRLKPSGIAVELLALRPSFGQLRRVSDLFHHDGVALSNHLRTWGD